MFHTNESWLQRPFLQGRINRQELTLRTGCSQQPLKKEYVGVADPCECWHGASKSQDPEMRHHFLKIRIQCFLCKFSFYWLLTCEQIHADVNMGSIQAGGDWETGAWTNGSKCLYSSIAWVFKKGLVTQNLATETSSLPNPASTNLVTS